MTFLSPWRLVLLLAPIALVAAYLYAQRVRQKYTVRFTSVDLLGSVAHRGVTAFEQMQFAVGVARSRSTRSVGRSVLSAAENGAAGAPVRADHIVR